MYIWVSQRYRADSKFVPSQWETSLQSNAVFHWLDAKLESALIVYPLPEQDIFNFNLWKDFVFSLKFHMFG